MDSSSTVTNSSDSDEFLMDSDVWDHLWEMGDPGALELVDGTSKLGFKDGTCETSS